MGHRRRRRSRSEKPKASVDMTSLIDLTFLLLVTFIVTLPALEGAIQIKLPEEKVNTPPPTKDRKANIVSIDVNRKIFFKDKPVTIEELEATLKRMAAEDPDVPVLVRGDKRLEYEVIMEVVSTVYRCKVKRMALITEEK